MPRATHEDLKTLTAHLLEAVQHCNKAHKAMLLGIPDVDVMSEADLNKHVIDYINGLITFALESYEITTWMAPHREGSFNQTKYELQALVKHAHDLLTTWQAQGGIHGDELSPAAASLFQLLINITSCSSGKAAGIHTAFVETPGLHNPISEEGLIDPLSDKFKAFLASREEADIQSRPKVLAFIQDANAFYHNFRLDLLNGDRPFLKPLTLIDVEVNGKIEKQDNQQPSHQRDYAYHVLGESLGLYKPEEIILVDIYGQHVHEHLENASPEALLRAYFGTVFEGGKNFTEALIERFHAHWSTKIEAGLNNPDASKAEIQAYNDFVKALTAAGINANTCLDTIEDDEGNDTFILKKSAIAEILCALGILKTR
jgi:hypothetical protein